MKNFWQNLKKPFLVQAPMENVTDTVFRQIIAKAGRPDVFFTEFTNTDGICSKGRKRVLQNFLYTQEERPLVAQIWGNNPKNYVESAKIIKDMGFDGIDINMGCPLVAKDSCVGLINNHPLIKELIAAAKEGGGGLPISVKTRIGLSNIQTEDWIGFLLEQDLDAITIHGRTKAELTKVPAHWDEIGKAVALRDKMQKKTVIIGNGDIKTREEIDAVYKQYGVDGIMIGRGIFTDLWIFNRKRTPADITKKEKLEMLIEHITLFSKTWGEKKDLNILKKFYKIYIADFPNAAEIRMTLMQKPLPTETIDFVQNLLKQ